MGGAFLCYGMFADRIYALESASVGLMPIAAMSAVTKIPAPVLEKLSKTMPSLEFGAGKRRVIAPAAMKNPITWFRRERPNRQRLAFVYQLSRQLLSGKQLFDLTPRVTFGEIVQGNNHEHSLAEIEHAARRTLAKHMAWSNV